MNLRTLTFVQAIDHPELLAPSVHSLLQELGSHFPVHEIEVAEINTVYAGGNDFCNHYGIPIEEGANCVIVEAIRGSSSQIAACLAPVNCRIDFNGVVRKTLHARRVSLAPLKHVLTRTTMEYGSITAIGLPKEWAILVDHRVVLPSRIVIGSGLLKSKLRIPTKLLLQLLPVKIVENLAISQ